MEPGPAAGPRRAAGGRRERNVSTTPRLRKSVSLHGARAVSKKGRERGAGRSKPSPSGLIRYQVELRIPFFFVTTKEEEGRTRREDRRAVAARKPWNCGGRRLDTRAVHPVPGLPLPRASLGRYLGVCPSSAPQSPSVYPSSTNIN